MTMNTLDTRSHLPLGALLDLVVLARVQHQLVWVVRHHARVPLVPVVRHRVREYRACSVERRRRDRPGLRVKGCDESERVRRDAVRGRTYSSAASAHPCPKSGSSHQRLHKKGQSRHPPHLAERAHAPHVENVPCTGWNEISFTAYTSDWSFAFGVWSLRWHLNEKLLDESFSSTYLRNVRA
jgi:hypothetical protein